MTIGLLQQILTEYVFSSYSSKSVLFTTYTNFCVVAGWYNPTYSIIVNIRKLIVNNNIDFRSPQLLPISQKSPVCDNGLVLKIWVCIEQK